MHTRIFIISLSMALALFISACGGQPKGEFTAEEQTAQQEAYQKMMDVHDVAMEKIAEMNRVARNLKPYRDSLQDETLIEEINFAVERLEGAEEAMMQWMAGSPKMGQLRDSLDHGQIMTLLEAEQEKIDGISEAMTSSLENAQALLARIQEPQNEG